jgi:hypothetical protein
MPAGANQYNYNYNYNNYNQAYDAVSDRNSQVFWDALSINSGSDRNSIAMSVYHSVPELHNNVQRDEHGNRIDKVKRRKKCLHRGQMKVKFDFVIFFFTASF